MKFSKMYKFYFLLVLFVILSSIKIPDLFAQEGGERFIRVAEEGQLIDSVNVWGDIGTAGRYLLPEGTNIPDLISYASGYNTLRDRETQLGWSAVTLEVKVSRLNENREAMEIAYFRYRYHDPEPIEMFDFNLQNNDIVTVQLKRKPTLRDYVQVLGTTISVIVTSLVFVERLR